MFSEKAKKIADAILYEGYLLYPYRASALKNRRRFNFGVLNPLADFGFQVLANAPETAEISIQIRFLHLRTRQIYDANQNKIERWESASGEISQTWQEAIEREIDCKISARDDNVKKQFAFTAEQSETILSDDKTKIVRRIESLRGEIEIKSEKRGEDLFCLTVKITNQNEKGGDSDLARSFVSTHALLRIETGEFVSLLEFPENRRGEIGKLKQNGLFPVLIEQNEMLASPIILYDFPRVAPESDGDFCDATEIDELLILRILTMTESEKREAAQLDERARKILAQAETSELANLHGAWRDVEIHEKAGGELKVNQKVVLKPKPRGDVFDLILAGKQATIARVETDFEGKTHVVVTVDDDDGKDSSGQKNVGHQFFFDPSEVELLDD